MRFAVTLPKKSVLAIDVTSPKTTDVTSPKISYHVTSPKKGETYKGMGSAARGGMSGHQPEGSGF